MSLTDLLIIYFACGAPFAVYHFLQNRRQNRTASFWLKNTFVFVFWLPFAVSLLADKSRREHFTLKFLKRISLTDFKAEKVSMLQKKIEQMMPSGDSNLSIFDFRETAERYTGLTLACEGSPSIDSEREIFRVAQNRNVELGAVCLQRRNRNKLVRHQTEARRDFLELIEELSYSVADAESLRHSADEIFEVLQDETAQDVFGKNFAGNLQTGKFSSVTHSEKDLWKTQERKPLNAEPISTR